MDKRKVLRIIVAIIATISALVTLASFGANLPLSPFSPVAFSTPIAADTNGSTTVVAATRPAGCSFWMTSIA